MAEISIGFKNKYQQASMAEISIGFKNKYQQVLEECHQIISNR